MSALKSVDLPVFCLPTIVTMGVFFVISVPREQCFIFLCQPRKKAPLPPLILPISGSQLYQHIDSKHKK